MATTRRMYGRPWAPRADIYETEESVVLQLDIPGVKPDEIDVQCEKGMLSIKGDRAFSGDVPGRHTDEKGLTDPAVTGVRHRYRARAAVGAVDALPHVGDVAPVDV